MAQKPENTFISGVHKYLPPIGELYRAKMHNPYTAGIPDWWYSGNKADMWVEYKYLPELPKRANTAIRPDLSELQLEWLLGRSSEGRRVYVVVGCPMGAVVFSAPGEWVYGISTEDFLKRIQSRQQLADWLKQSVTR